MIILFSTRKCDNCAYIKSFLHKCNITYRSLPIKILKQGANKIYPELVNLLADLVFHDWDGTAPVACWDGEALTYPMICEKLGIEQHKCKDGVCSI